MTDTNQTVAPEPTDTDAVSVTKTTDQDKTEQGHCGGRHHHCSDGHGRSGCGGWRNKRRMKLIGAVVLITLFGFMLGRGSAHHHGHHMEGRHGHHQQMESYSRGGNAPSLSTLLDGIGATPEQRSKAVELFLR